MSIPKIIHYCWFGGNAIPENDLRCMESWKRMCPDYTIIEWNEENYDVQKNDYMKEAYEAKKWGFVPDYARLDILSRHGGIYLDTDVELIRPLDDLLDLKAFIGFESDAAVNPGLIIASEPCCPIISEMRDEVYNERRFRRADGTYDMVASPKLITDFLIKRGLVCNNKLQTIYNLTIFPKDYFCPKDYITGEIILTDNSYSIHYYNASWQTEKQKKWHRFETSFANRFGMLALEKNKKTMVWKGAEVAYTRGLIYCAKRVFQKRKSR